MTASREQQTKQTYDYAFKVFVYWCKSKGHTSLPASAETVALYLVSLAQEGACKSSVHKAFYAIKWFHSLNGVNSNPCGTSSWLKLCLEGCCRLVSRLIQKKEPVPVDILKRFVDKFGSLNCTLSDLRITTLALVSFAGFLRFREAARIRRSDISFYETYCCIMIRESKTDVYIQGDQLFIARTGTPFCPVNMLERYFATTGLNDSTSNEFIFRAIMFCSKFNKHILRPDKFRSLSYSTVRSTFLAKLSDLGLNPKAYGLPFLRAGVC